ncbi:MAG TPA: DUF2203 family protein [Planctomycetota bacterium]|nr:DUF2203 family protein [Planctomycetota bacterium]
MKRVYTLPEANALLPLIKAIGREIVERTALRRQLHRNRQRLEEARTPEGLLQELAELDARICAQDEGIAGSRREFEGHGMTVNCTHPLTVHIPGHSRSGPVVFCWQDGEGSLGFGHPLGEEEELRRPLRLKAV